MKTRLFSVIFISLLALSFFSVVNLAQAAPGAICFRPNVPIPGMSAIFGRSNNTNCPNGGYNITPDSIGLYISALYTYAARLAAAVAMFMVVFGAWQWMMAAGNSSKIENAKETIQGALIGLALLFAGQLLLNNISSRLVTFDGLDLESISAVDSNNTSTDFQAGQESACSASEQTQTVRCGSLFNMTVQQPYEYTLQCYGHLCDGDLSCVYLKNVEVDGGPIGRYLPCPDVFNRSTYNPAICSCVRQEEIERVNGPQ